jgi:uncharacterized protein
MTRQSSSPRVVVRRHPERGRYERATVHAILDEAVVCHLGVVVDSQPLVMPTAFARVEDTLYLHGAAANQGLSAAAGAPICVTVSLIDGLVFSRSAFGHSMNYRSVVVLGTGRAVEDPGEHERALEAVVEHIAPGRWGEVRTPSAKEVALTRVIALDLDECSAKVRSGPPVDPSSDRALPIWAGEVPLRLVAGSPVTAPEVPAGVAEPLSVTAAQRRFAG